MESVSAEELLIEEGKSSKLIAAFQALEETTVDEGPKYSPKTCRELARAIACRSYGKCLLELAYLLVIASACDRRTGRYESFFWAGGPARASAFRGYIEMCQPLAPNVRTGGNGVEVQTDEENFTVTFSRMPFLSALLEFLMTTVGYEELDGHVTPLLAGVPPRATIGEAANDIARALYDYLKEHLPSAHTQRKARHLIDFVSEQCVGRVGPEDVTDSVLLEFWIDRSDNEEESNDYKTYQSVFAAGVELRLLMSYALDKYRMDGARSIGVDVEAGEVDPGDIEDAMEVLEAMVLPLRALSEPPLDAVKFLNGRESETASEIALGPGIATALARSVFRNAVFGRAQSRITNALRHKRLTSQLVSDPAETDYPARLEGYRQLTERLDKSLLAVLHVLATARRPEAIELAIAISPDMDLTGLSDAGSDEPEWEDANIVSITAMRAAENFFDRAGARAGDGDPLSALMADARKAFRANARQGFGAEDVENGDIVDAFADAVRPLLALRKEIEAFVAAVDEVDWLQPFSEDREVFGQQFQRLYGEFHDD